MMRCRPQLFVVPFFSSALLGLTCHCIPGRTAMALSLFHTTSSHVHNHDDWAVARGKRRRERRFYSASSRSEAFSSSSYEKRTADVHPPSATSKTPFFRIYYNDVYEVHLPPRHRFPMKKYAQVRAQLQRWISELPKEEQELVQCGE